MSPPKTDDQVTFDSASSDPPSRYFRLPARPRASPVRGEVARGGDFPHGRQQSYEARMEPMHRQEIVEGLNVFRALESWGATLYAAWAERETDPHLRAGHLIIAEREATH